MTVDRCDVNDVDKVYVIAHFCIVGCQLIRNRGINGDLIMEMDSCELVKISMMYVSAAINCHIPAIFTGWNARRHYDLDYFIENEFTLNQLIMVFLLCFMLCVVSAIVCSCIMEPCIISHITSMESLFYDRIFQISIINGWIPTYLAAYLEGAQDCGICLDPLSQEQQTILHCGHRYHHSCLRQWELEQYDMNLNRYRCAYCQRSYRWTQKWVL